MKKHVGTISLGLSLVLGMSGCSQKSIEKDLRDDSSEVVSSSAESKLNTIMAPVASTVGVMSGRDGVNSNKNSRISSQVTSSDVVNGVVLSDIKMDDMNSLQSVYFSFDRFEIREDMINRVNNNVEIAKSYPSSSIKIEGNCDEWGTDEYNYALGLKRAKTVRDNFVANGVDGNSLMLISYGESNPVCTDKSETCWQNNRRVDLRIID